MGLRTAILDRLAAAAAHQDAEDRRRLLASFARVGTDVRIGRLPEVYSAECIELGDRVSIGNFVRLQAIRTRAGVDFEPLIRLGADVSLENGCTITCNNRVLIDDGVLVAGNVYISDHAHVYADVETPVARQPITTGGVVRIGAGSHIGQNVCILGDVAIGEHVVVGANAVVTRDLPARTVAVGAPARVVRRYEEESRSWVHV